MNKEVRLPYGVTAGADIDADDYELAEAALAATDTRNGEPVARALRMLRDECGWTLGKAKCVIDLIQASQPRGR